MISRVKGFAAVTAAVAATALMPATSAQATTSATYAEFYDNANFCCSSIYSNGDGGRCYNLPTYFVNTVSSVQSNTRWVLYSRPGCWSDAQLLDYTGSLSYVGDNANDRTISVKVY
jgi:hypothetical protein